MTTVEKLSTGPQGYYPYGNDAAASDEASNSGYMTPTGEIESAEANPIAFAESSPAVAVASANSETSPVFAADLSGLAEAYSAEMEDEMSDGGFPTAAEINRSQEGEEEFDPFAVYMPSSQLPGAERKEASEFIFGQDKPWAKRAIAVFGAPLASIAFIGEAVWKVALSVWNVAKSAYFGVACGFSPAQREEYRNLAELSIRQAGANLETAVQKVNWAVFLVPFLTVQTLLKPVETLQRTQLFLDGWDQNSLHIQQLRENFEMMKVIKAAAAQSHLIPTADGEDESAAESVEVASHEATVASSGTSVDALASADEVAADAAE